MGKERKSPQEKKQLEYTRDHFTGGFNSSRGFPAVWKRKKAKINRQFRRKSDELLAPLKPGIAASDAKNVSDDLTAGRFQQSVSRKRLRKVSTITVGEKVKNKLDRRAEAVGRRKHEHRFQDERAAAAARVLNGISDDRLPSVARQMDLLCRQRNGNEKERVRMSQEPLDRALYFLYEVSWGSRPELDALQRNPEIGEHVRTWIRRATRLIEKENRRRERELEERRTAKSKTRILSGQSHKASNRRDRSAKA